MVLPGVGTFVGGVIGGVVGSLTGDTVGKKVSGKIYDHEIHKKCALCWMLTQILRQKGLIIKFTKLIFKKEASIA